MLFVTYFGTSGGTVVDALLDRRIQSCTQGETKVCTKCLTFVALEAS